MSLLPIYHLIPTITSFTEHLLAAEKQLDISPCTALRRLHFDFRREREPLVRDWRREREPLLRDWSWLRYLLSHVTAHNLRTIVFSFQSSSHALMQLRASSGELDRALVEASFMSSLETLRFAFDRRCARNVDGDGDEDEDKDVEALLDAFSALRAKGVLEGVWLLCGPIAWQAYIMILMTTDSCIKFLWGDLRVGKVIASERIGRCGGTYREVPQYTYHIVETHLLIVDTVANTWIWQWIRNVLQKNTEQVQGVFLRRHPTP